MHRYPFRSCLLLEHWASTGPQPPWTLSPNALFIPSTSLQLPSSGWQALVTIGDYLHDHQQLQMWNDQALTGYDPGASTLLDIWLSHQEWGKTLTSKELPNSHGYSLQLGS